MVHSRCLSENLSAQTPLSSLPPGISFYSVFRKLGFVFAALALFSIAGGHWAVLQSVAWAEMLRDYTQKTGSVALAAEQTFDGAHPCELCLQIASAKQQEGKAQSDKQKPADQKTAKAEKPDKALPLAEHFSPVWTAATSLRWDATAPHASPSCEDQPPTPPPRSGTIAA